jgi:hypothetical protein
MQIAESMHSKINEVKPIYATTADSPILCLLKREILFDVSHKNTAFKFS